MVRPLKPKKQIDPAKADAFASLADKNIKRNNDINFNNENMLNKRKRGNPRVKKNKAVSFSLPIELDEQIDSVIIQLQNKGFFGVTRSDIVVALLSGEGLEINNLIKRIKHIKGV